jgi:hypothetical protein
MAFRIYTGDTRPTLRFDLSYDDGSGPLDVSGATVTIVLAPVGGTGGEGVYGDLCTIVDGPNGIVTYKLPQPFSLPPGVSAMPYQAQLTIDFGSGDIQTSDPVDVVVVKKLGRAL